MGIGSPKNLLGPVYSSSEFSPRNAQEFDVTGVHPAGTPKALGLANMQPSAWCRREAMKTRPDRSKVIQMIPSHRAILQKIDKSAMQVVCDFSIFADDILHAARIGAQVI
jgi:hypothetical protein